MDCERRRPWRSWPPSPSFSAPRHICSLCGKPRSSSYQKRHPIAPGQAPAPGVCSRPRCAKAVTDMLLAPCPRVVVYEIHHHYHTSSALSLTKGAVEGAVELPGESSLAGRTELHGDYK